MTVIMVNNKIIILFINVFSLFVAAKTFAEFNVVINNERDMKYREVVVGMHGVGFNANYGRIHITEIDPDTRTVYTVPSKLNYIPLTGTGFSCDTPNCNLKINIIAAPESGTLQTFEKENVLKTPKIILADEQNSSNKLEGLQPPDMEITITEAGITAVFYEYKKFALEEGIKLD